MDPCASLREIVVDRAMLLHVYGFTGIVSAANGVSVKIEQPIIAWESTHHLPHFLGSSPLDALGSPFLRLGMFRGLDQGNRGGLVCEGKRGKRLVATAGKGIQIRCKTSLRGN